MSMLQLMYHSHVLLFVAAYRGISMDELYQQDLLSMDCIRFIESLLSAQHPLILWSAHNVDAVIATA